MEKYKPILIKKGIPEAGDLCLSNRYGDKILRFGEFENSYQNECTKVLILIVDTEAEIKKGDIYYDIGTCTLETWVANFNCPEGYGYKLVALNSRNPKSPICIIEKESIDAFVDTYNMFNYLPEYLYGYIKAGTNEFIILEVSEENKEEKAYSKKEVEEILEKYSLFVWSNGCTKKDLETWKEKNLK